MLTTTFNGRRKMTFKKVRRETNRVVDDVEDWIDRAAENVKDAAKDVKQRTVKRN